MAQKSVGPVTSGAVIGRLQQNCRSRDS